MIIERLADLKQRDFEAETGWEIKPEGACKGHVCVPHGMAADTFDVLAVAEKLGMAAVRDEAAGLLALGPETLDGRSLTTAEAPELVLPDALSGSLFQLSSLRGRKVVVAAWAPY